MKKKFPALKSFPRLHFLKLKVTKTTSKQRTREFKKKQYKSEYFFGGGGGAPPLIFCVNSNFFCSGEKCYSFHIKT